MSDRTSIIVIWMLIIAVITCFGGTVLGTLLERNLIHKQAIQSGVGQFNQTTGQFEFIQMEAEDE